LRVAGATTGAGGTGPPPVGASASTKPHASNPASGIDAASGTIRQNP
jgi:hypothetical protein